MEKGRGRGRRGDRDKEDQRRGRLERAREEGTEDRRRGDCFSIVLHTGRRPAAKSPGY